MQRFLRTLFLIGSLLSAATASAGSFESACGGRSLADTSVQVESPAVEVDPSIHRVPVRQLTSHVYGAASELQDSATFGLTTAKPNFSRDFDLVFIEDKASRRVCFRPRVSVSLALSLQITLAHELKEGSCSFQMVKDHEDEHVDVYRSMLPVVAKSIELDIAERIGSHVRYAESVDAALRVVEELLESSLKPAIDKGIDQVMKAQDALDAPEHAVKRLNACNGEFVAIIQKGVAIAAR